MDKKTITQIATAALITTAGISVTNNIKPLNVTGSGSEVKAATNQSAQQFINKAASAATNASSKYGTYTSVMIAQAAVESGWGNSTLSQEPNNNLFGIKGSYNGQSVTMNTGEYGANGYYTTNANFRKYPSYEESFNDNGALLRSQMGNYYSGAWVENANSGKEATQNGLQGKYATAPNYSDTLNKVIDTYNLQQYDPTTTSVNETKTVTKTTPITSAPVDSDVATQIGTARVGQVMNISKYITYKNGVSHALTESGWVNSLAFAPTGQTTSTTQSTSQTTTTQVKAVQKPTTNTTSETKTTQQPVTSTKPAVTTTNKVDTSSAVKKSSAAKPLQEVIKTSPKPVVKQSVTETSVSKSVKEVKSVTTPAKATKFEVAKATTSSQSVAKPAAEVKVASPKVAVTKPAQTKASSSSASVVKSSIKSVETTPVKLAKTTKITTPKTTTKAKPVSQAPSAPIVAKPVVKVTKLATKPIAQTETTTKVAAQANYINNNIVIYKAKGVVTINAKPDYGVVVWSQPGKNPTNRFLKNGTSWKFFKIAIINGMKWYNLGGNQWVPAKAVMVR
ncbi:flagellum-specific peptidoglycan hydrolase FlgJ [Lactobacillus colini]|uniref:Flagellum-specific peptidoglycan hydrolase FlgJ n=1 Tax=Lactobacillus colini TaxID=1819254 RepID=A0ABS4MDD0_9LACO|nr:glucosaminidase domain-containing protein [Lactobacillus colini]MBP2057409.1 flagellum-specific peptidoglycan hydrolase FlgJ [Lactobacillus colini]